MEAYGQGGKTKNTAWSGVDVFFESINYMLMPFKNINLNAQFAVPFLFCLLDDSGQS